MAKKCYKVESLNEIISVDRKGKEKSLGMEWRNIRGIFIKEGKDFKSEKSAQSMISKLKRGRGVRVGVGKDVKLRVRKSGDNC